MAIELPVQRRQRRQPMSLPAPSVQQTLEHRRQLAALQFRMQREDLVAAVFGAREQRLVHVALVDAVGADQFVQRRQRGRQLHVTARLAVEHRHIGLGAAAIRRIAQAPIVELPERFRIHLPAGGAVRGRGRAEHRFETLPRPPHLRARPCGVARAHVVLPVDVVPGMDAAFVAGAARRAHRLGRAQADVRARQQHAIHQRAQAVVRDHRGTRHLAQKSRAEHAPQRPAGMVGSEAEQEGRAGVVRAQQRDQLRHALARAAQRVDVNLQGDRGHRCRASPA